MKEVSKLEISKRYNIDLNEDEFDTILNCLKEFAFKHSEFINLPLNEKKAKKLIEELEDKK